MRLFNNKAKDTQDAVTASPAPGTGQIVEMIHPDAYAAAIRVKDQLIEAKSAEIIDLHERLERAAAEQEDKIAEVEVTKGELIDVRARFESVLKELQEYNNRGADALPLAMLEEIACWRVLRPKEFKVAGPKGWQAVKAYTTVSDSDARRMVREMFPEEFGRALGELKGGVS